MPALTAEQKEHFEEYGFVHVEDVFDPEGEIDPVIDEYAGLFSWLEHVCETQDIGRLRGTP